MTLTLITVNFNGSEDTIRLLRSLERQTNTAFDVIVVDNDSRAEERHAIGEYATSSPLSLDVVYAQQNSGFAGGNAVGIRKALAQGADWVMLINNDTTVEPDFIAEIMRQLPDTPALVGIPLDEGDRVVGAGRVQWLASTLPHVRTVDAAATDTYAIGAGLVIHRDVIERIGMLDNAYFLYFEDADYSVRARRAGVPVLFLTTPAIRHAVSGSTKSLGSPLLLRYHMRNAIRFNRLHAPVWARLLVPMWLLWVVTKQCIKLIGGRARAQSLALLAGVRDGLLNRTGPIDTRPRIAFECESLEDTSWGTAREVRGLLNALVALPEVRERYTIVAYFKSHIPDEPWLHYPNVRAVLVKPFRFLPSSFSLYFYVFFPIRVWFDRPAVTYIANYMLPLIFRGRSIVMLTEDIWSEMHGSALPFKYRLAYRIFATWAAARATRIMAISHTSGLRVAELFGISPARIAVNELAVSPPIQVAPRAGTYMLYVAQGLPRRHLRETIMAFAEMAVRHPELTLFAIGPDKYSPPIIDSLMRSTNVTLGREAVVWVTRVSDEELASAYAGARAFVYVSDVEAFGLPPIEALSYGVPSVLLDRPVHREIFGDNAFYATDTEIPTLAAVFERALFDTTRRSHIIAAADSVLSRYTWEGHAQRMLSTIKQIT